jgi:hypothetical protein
MKISEFLSSRKTVVMWAAVGLGFILLAVLVSLTSAVVFALFFAFLILDVDRGVPLAASFVLLLIAAFLLAMKQNTSASALSEWSYFFLSIGVILMLIDYLVKGRRGVEESVEASSAEVEWSRGEA